MTTHDETSAGRESGDKTVLSRRVAKTDDYVQGAGSAGPDTGERTWLRRHMPGRNDKERGCREDDRPEPEDYCCQVLSRPDVTGNV